jgi:hypothetical protein
MLELRTQSPAKPNTGNQFQAGSFGFSGAHLSKSINNLLMRESKPLGGHG